VVAADQSESSRTSAMAIVPETDLIQPVSDPAALEHDDRVGAPHRGQPMGDHERGAVQHQRHQGVLHQTLRFGVER